MTRQQLLDELLAERYGQPVPEYRKSFADVEAAHERRDLVEQAERRNTLRAVS